MSATVVFAGPTISAVEIRHHLPNACVHPPVKTGDILRIMRILPERLILLDGYYENTPSVWHKEILYALSRGVEVLGASSMGALRAAELHHFGMRPIGKIANAYCSGTLDKDDEVALLHMDAEQHFSKQSEALVNIRASLANAKQQGTISAVEETQLLEQAESTFYPNRTYLALLNNSTLNQKQQNWIMEHAIDLKQQDAIEALKWAREHPAQPHKANFTLSEPFYLYALLFRMNSRAFSTAYPWLPAEEQTLCRKVATLPAGMLKLFTELAYISQIVFQVLSTHPDMPSNTPPPDVKRSPCDDQDLVLVLRWLHAHKQQQTNDASRLDQFNTLHRLLFFQSDSRESHSNEALIHDYTTLWWALNNQLNNTFLRCHPKYSTHTLHKFWVEMGLETEVIRKQWLKKHGIELPVLQQWCKLTYRHHIMNQYFAGKGLTSKPTLQVKNWLAALLQYYHTL